MKKQNTLFAYLLIGIGVFFLLRQLKIPIITNFYSWQSLLIIIGLVLLIYSYTTKSHQNLFIGTILLGFGIHLHGLKHYHFWIEHWAVYPLIIGIAFVVRALKTKKGYVTGFLLIVFSLLILFSANLSPYFYWINDVIHSLETYWPVILIVIGIYILWKRK
ncbi:LiaI-LiaF-like domain-containing protein [Oceanobacillus bengalensis]|uniref:LiaI-LiaF-like transmembrane region domain-containing protein n=1 Tax=Oceanobacillus bengalensis TaxID=1435466 RepID=A0A494Z6M9_9BACI|nr:DUF5668 domain-containing protein [Oceanobacillus bengalensis]RKQ17955.1 hypothetical protein D8M05_03450 [Oceanobacillus bengalensis]